MKKEERRKLLEHVADLTSDAESGPDEKIFFPVRAHGRALRSEVVVIEGVRGAGKTALFHVVQKLGGKLPAFYGDDAIPAAKWISCYSNDLLHPQAAALDAFARQHTTNDEPLRSWWLGHLVGRLLFETGAGNGHRPAVAAPDPFAPIDPIKTTAELDRIERELKPNELVFATYDYLDQIGALETTVRRRWIRALLALWLPLSTRYRKIRPKIFLRHDLFDEAQHEFPDASKLRSRAQSLDWRVDDLFGLVVRHLANAGPSPEAAREWLQKDAGLSLRESAEFGWMCEPLDEEQRKTFARAIAGEVMGSGSRKGFVFRWIPNHLQDAGGRIVPRSILRLLGLAARHALDAGSGAASVALLAPTDLQSALGDTSRQRADELREEHPLVLRLENLKSKILLLDPDEAKKELAKPTSSESDSMKEIKNGAAVLDELRRLGVISVRDDGRIDVPDIYREGFGIKRKGGTRIA